MSFKEELRELVKNSFVGSVRKAISETFPSKDFLRERAKDGYRSYTYIMSKGNNVFIFGEKRYEFTGDEEEIDNKIFALLREELENRGLDLDLCIGGNDGYVLYW